jgi:hypothetical protein
VVTPQAQTCKRDRDGPKVNLPPFPLPLCDFPGISWTNNTGNTFELDECARESAPESVIGALWGQKGSKWALVIVVPPPEDLRPFQDGPLVKHVQAEVDGSCTSLLMTQPCTARSKKRDSRPGMITFTVPALQVSLS